jgi:hypothetical protein
MMFATLLLAASVLGQPFPWDQGPRVSRATGGATAHVWLHHDDFAGPSHLMFSGPGGASEVTMSPGTAASGKQDVEIDDDGNYVIVWTATDVNGVERAYMLYNSFNGANALANNIGGQTGELRVTMSRTGGKITMGWLGGGQSNLGRGRYGAPVFGQRFQVTGGQVAPNGGSFVATPFMYYTHFHFGNLSCGSSGDPVFVYLKTSSSGSGVYVKGFNYADASVKFGETLVTALSSIHYAFADVDCSNDGGFYAAYHAPGVTPAVGCVRYGPNGNSLSGHAISNGGFTQAWIAVATRKDNVGGTAPGCSVAWAGPEILTWVIIGAMQGTGGTLPESTVYSGAADGDGNFIFDYINDDVFFATAP